MPKRRKRRAYVKRQDYAPAEVRVAPTTRVWLSTNPDAFVDPRDLAAKHVNDLKGQRGKDGRKHSRDKRIELAAESFGLSDEELRTWMNRAKKAR